MRRFIFHCMRVFVVLAVGFLGGMGNPGQAAQLYGVTGFGADTPKTLYKLNQSDGSFTFIRTLGNGDFGEEIAFNVDDGLIYHASGFQGGRILETIDPDTLAIMSISLSGDVYEEVGGLAYDASSGKLFAGDVDDDRLFSITTTGESAFIGSADHQLKAMAFVGSTLYSISDGKLVRFTSGDFFSLKTIDPNTGATTGTTALTFLPPDSVCDNTGTKPKCDGKATQSATALATHPETGMLWAVLKIDYGNTAGRVRRLAVIDPVTAVGVFVADDPLMGLADKIAGLAFGPASTPADNIEGVVEELVAIIEANPGSSISDKVDDVIASLETALEELAKTPPDNQAAIGNLEGAVGDLEAAIDEGLDSNQGTQLMDNLAGVARRMATDALDQAIAEGGDSGEISDSQDSLEIGDALRDSDAFKDAVNKYKDALSKAESAIS